MKIKNFLFISLSLFLNSCISLDLGVFSIQKTEYDYEYKTFTKGMDFTKGNFLLAPTILSNKKELDKNTLTFFKKRLKKRLTITSDLKNNQGKYLIPFNVKFDLTKKELDILKEASNYDYLIVSKIISLDESRNIGLRKYRNTKLNSNHKSGGEAILRIYDLNSLSSIIEIECLGTVLLSEEDRHNNDYLYLNSNYIGHKALEKNSKKLKKHSEF